MLYYEGIITNEMISEERKKVANQSSENSWTPTGDFPNNSKSKTNFT